MCEVNGVQRLCGLPVLGKKENRCREENAGNQVSPSGPAMHLSIVRKEGQGAASLASRHALPFTYIARRPKRNETSQMIRNTKNRIFAMPTAVPASPPNPRTAAINAMTRKTSDQCSIYTLPVQAMHRPLQVQPASQCSRLHNFPEQVRLRYRIIQGHP